MTCQSIEEEALFEKFSALIIGNYLTQSEVMGSIDVLPKEEEKIDIEEKPVPEENKQMHESKAKASMLIQEEKKWRKGKSQKGKNATESMEEKKKSNAQGKKETKDSKKKQVEEEIIGTKSNAQTTEGMESNKFRIFIKDIEYKANKNISSFLVRISKKKQYHSKRSL